jgi:CubicO group peptidase (beta-lactamase class C family)
MKNTLRWSTMAFVIALAAWPTSAASVQAAKPEEVGISNERLQRIHETIQRHIAAGDISGAVTLVARRGRIAHFEAHGLMDIDAKKAMQKDALFRIASMSKPITGTAILMLIEEGKIRLTDPVSKFIPEFKGMKVAVVQEGGAGGRGAAAGRGAAGAEPQFYTVPANREITIRDLLSHVSGLVSGGVSTAEANKLGRKPTDTLADYIPRLGATPLEFQPGSRWSYSPSAGFDTLGRIVEIVSGEPFDRFLRERIFGPLEMKDTTFYPAENQLPRVATRYQKTANGLTKQQGGAPSNVYFSGAGGLSSTAEDYAQFGQMLLNGGQLNGKPIAESQDGGSDGFRARAGHSARPRSGTKFWIECASGEQRGRLQLPGLRRQLRLGWRLRYALLDRSQREGSGHPDGPDLQPGDHARFRERGDAGDGGIKAHTHSRRWPRRIRAKGCGCRRRRPERA